MAEIKISDLSVGDWVRHTFYEENLRIKRIDGESERLLVEKGLMSVSCHLDHFEPILLTPEILEKNGFVKCGRCCTSRTTAYIKDFTFVNHLEERKVWRVKIYGEEGLVELCSILVHHTHQLQHALRLAGVEKEIEV